MDATEIPAPLKTAESTARRRLQSRRQVAGYVVTVRHLPWIVLALAFAPLSCSLFASETQPNLLVITVDGLRFDAISQSLGSARTPNMHALAGDGQRFTHCYSHSPVGLPAHVALFSGRTPQSTGVANNGVAIDRDVTLLAEYMKKRGYLTAAAVSLASLWAPPPREGEHDSRMNKNIQPTGLERGFDSYAIGPHELVSATEVNQRLLGQLDAFPQHQPWFLFAQYSEPHEPFDAWQTENVEAEVLVDGKVVAKIPVSESADWDQELRLTPGTHVITFRAPTNIEVRRFECFSDTATIDVNVREGGLHAAAKQLAFSIHNESDAPAMFRCNAWVHDVPDVQQCRARYKLEVEAVDRAIGELVAALEQRGEYEDTLIVLTSDHGTALGEHGHVGSGYALYDELLRVPLVIKLPQRSTLLPKLAKLEHSSIRQIDIMPTVLELLDEGSLSGADGVSILQDADRTLLAEVHPPEAPNSYFCVRDDRYKLVYSSSTARFALYDVLADTLEADDVFELQGHFRSAWQADLKRLASASSHEVNQRMGLAAERPAHLQSLGD